MGTDMFARVETGRERLRSFLRFIIFTLATFAVATAIVGTEVLVLGQDIVKKYPVAYIGIVLAIIIVTAAQALITKHKLAMFGFGGPHGLRNFVVGTLAGFGILALVLAVMLMLGVFSFGTLNPLDASLGRWALIYIGMFLAVSLMEETLFRGYGLVQLSRSISFWPALLVMALLFGGVHGGNPGENPAGLLSAAGFGAVLAISFRLTGSLWFAMGFHTSWNYGETFIFGVANSGHEAKHALLQPIFHGPEWLTGGSAGPEGSVLVAGPLLAIILISWLLRAKAAPA